MNKLGTIDACTSNVGGSIMINQMRKNHTLNLMTMKKTVDNGLPWSYRKNTKTSNASPMRASTNSPNLKNNSLNCLKEVNGREGSSECKLDLK